MTLTISSSTFTSNSAYDVSPFPELFSGLSLTLPQSFFGPSPLLGAFSTAVFALATMTHAAFDPGESELLIALLFVHF